MSLQLQYCLINFKILFISSCFLIYLIHFSFSPFITAKSFAIQPLQYEKSTCWPSFDTAHCLINPESQVIPPLSRVPEAQRGLISYIRNHGVLIFLSTSIQAKSVYSKLPDAILKIRILIMFSIFHFKVVFST